MMKLGIISDTHGLLRPEVISELADCDAILHSGDINKQEIIDRLNQIAPTYVVRGNNDKDWAEQIPYELQLELGGISIYMTHKKKDIPKDVSAYQLVVYGHSHKYSEKTVDGVCFLNPGSCGPRRFDQEITMATAVIETGEINVQKIEIPHEKRV